MAMSLPLSGSFDTAELPRIASEPVTVTVARTVAPGWEAVAGVHRGFSPVAPGSPAAALPETAWSWELGARAAPRDTHAELVGFFSDYDNLTGTCTLSSGCDPAQVDQQFNGGRAWVYGVEALASQALDLPKGHRLSAEATGTWTHSQFRSSFTSDFTQFGSVDAGDALPYVPPWQGAIQLADDHRIGGLAVAVRARGPMRDRASQGPIDPDRDIPASAVVDASARLRVYRSLTSYVQVTNATDAVVLESWRPFGARPAAPLQAMVGVKAGAW